MLLQPRTSPVCCRVPPRPVTKSEVEVILLDEQNLYVNSLLTSYSNSRKQNRGADCAKVKDFRANWEVHLLNRI
jgi:hypothetical protein